MSFSKFDRARISIHAPTRGATFPCLPIFRPHDIFQSTLPREERPDKSILWSRSIRFQSTLPREERPSLFGVV
ncbi:Hypothetical protein EUBREC_2488 [Agathobacter rectalis ATCC 33656]|uniref:Uncharacterized protein n=1 Tax=Agathobacter rectalis (strain ATCC 33656 / DSM 3377 / JCM 17463 / KCTC 5835 / VPI 0990) TaxID=515619 RepID=C4ZG13_AGARV|nr:Hypothetical protein EUBREC_2488 [Agathobacter rectalis ATCC 33656]